MGRNVQLIKSAQTRGLRQIYSQGLLADNQQVTIDVPRGPHIEGVWITIAGTINVTTAFTAARQLAPYYMVRRADWVINSNATMDSISGPQAYQLQAVTRRNLPVSISPAVAVGPTSFRMTIFLDRALMDMGRPKDSLQKTDAGMSNNQIKLQLGALANMFIGAGAATYTAVTVKAHVIDYQCARDSNGETYDPLYYIKRNGFNLSVQGAGNGQQFRVNTGNRLRLLSLRVLDATTLEPNSALCTRLKLSRAGDTRVDVDAAELGFLNAGAYGGQLASGQFVIDIANVGQVSGIRYSEFWPIPSAADTNLFVDTTAPCILECATIEGVDVPKA
jgi:hypothetical protein